MTIEILLILMSVFVSIANIVVIIAIFDITNRIHTYLQTRQKLNNDRYDLHTKQIELYKKVLGE